MAVRDGMLDLIERVRALSGATVGMGAVVTKDIPAGETWVGVPAHKLER